MSCLLLFSAFAQHSYHFKKKEENAPEAPLFTLVIPPSLPCKTGKGNLLPAYLKNSEKLGCFSLVKLQMCASSQRSLSGKDAQHRGLDITDKRAFLQAIREVQEAVEPYLYLNQATLENPQGISCNAPYKTIFATFLSHWKQPPSHQNIPQNHQQKNANTLEREKIIQELKALEPDYIAVSEMPKTLVYHSRFCDENTGKIPTELFLPDFRHDYRVADLSYLISQVLEKLEKKKLSKLSAYAEIEGMLSICNYSELEKTSVMSYPIVSLFLQRHTSRWYSSFSTKLKKRRSWQRSYQEFLKQREKSQGKQRDFAWNTT